MANGFDCATKLNATSAKALKAAGFEFVARYLGDSWKTFDAAEANAVRDAGLKLISIFEESPLRVSYFTKSQGIKDAQEAYKRAKAVGQPAGTAIYFTVDYDAQPADIGAIIEYLSGIKQCFVDYKVGLYGSYAVMMAVKGCVDYYWQTYAWSKGKVADHIHIHQYQNGVTVSGVQLDRNDIKMDPGAWGQPQQEKQSNGILMVVKVLQNTDVRAEPSHSSGYLGDARKDEMYNVWDHKGDWHYIILDPKINKCGWVDGNGGKNLYWLDNPALKQQSSAPQDVYHKVVTGDIVSKLASRYGSTIAQIKAWNNLDDKCTIYAGKSIRVK
jgi:hypothetical protein